MATDVTSLLDNLNKKISGAQLPPDLLEIVGARLQQLSLMVDSSSFLPELDRMNRYIDWITVLPWNRRTQDTLDLKKAEEILNRNHHGLADLKSRVLEYIAVMQLKLQTGEGFTRAPILCFVGLVGTGKTTMAVSIAEVLGRKFARIPFGGMGDPLDLRGQSRMHPEAEPGKIIKALRASQTRNPVILLDEIDRVTDEGRASIMGVLVELLDPRQNQGFVDHYIDYPFDLSEVLFIATANNTTNIATAVLDRLEPINMPSYNDDEKITIGKKYLLPKAMEEAGLSPDNLEISDDVWSSLVRPLGFDAGIRTLERTIQGLCRKVAKVIVEGGTNNVKINPQNVKEFIPNY